MGYLLASLLIFCIILLLLEFYRIHTIKQGVDIELSRTVNIALDLSMMDLYRRDRQLELDVAVAREQVFSYLHTELELDGNLRYYDGSGNEVFELVIDELYILGSPPTIRLSGGVYIRPTYFGNMYLNMVRFPVKVASQNKRID